MSFTLTSWNVAIRRRSTRVSWCHLISTKTIQSTEWLSYPRPRGRSAQNWQTLHYLLIPAICHATPLGQPLAMLGCSNTCVKVKAFLSCTWTPITPRLILLINTCRSVSTLNACIVVWIAQWGLNISDAKTREMYTSHPQSSMPKYYEFDIYSSTVTSPRHHNNRIHVSRFTNTIPLQTT